jgi:monofunctional biosynthetic peptidoglycan transglycosylase
MRSILAVISAIGIAAILGAPDHGMAAGEVKVNRMETTRILVDFGDPEEAKRWRAINDGVMGGLSQSHLVSATDTSAVFEGTLSLENNGGFASVRRAAPDEKLSEAKAIILQVKGDGRRYDFRFRTEDRFDGVAYRASFITVEGEWREVVLPIGTFQATFRGRSAPGAPALEPGKIRQMGFLVAEKRPGTFRLEVRTIAVRGVATSGGQL